MKRVMCFLAVGVCAAWLAPKTYGVEITIGATKDNTIYSDNTDRSNGIGPRIDFGRNNGGAFRRALIAFDVAGSVPAGSTVNSARLEIFNFNNTSISEAHDYDVHFLLADWGEGTSSTTMGSGATATTGDATWNARFFDTTSPTLWTTAGGDFNTTASATTNVGDTTVDTFIVWQAAQLTADVQSFLDTPASNFGWILIGNEAATTKSVRDFRSKDHATASEQPRLVIDFTPIPEPSVLVLTGLGGLGIVIYRSRRKRRAAPTR